jgi:hypothetical protein
MNNRRLMKRRAHRLIRRRIKVKINCDIRPFALAIGKAIRPLEEFQTKLIAAAFQIPKSMIEGGSS